MNIAKWQTRELATELITLIENNSSPCIYEENNMPVIGPAGQEKNVIIEYSILQSLYNHYKNDKISLEDLVSFLYAQAKQSLIA